MTDKFYEFKKAYDQYPSQDQEGYVPNRSDFKMGFMAAWHVQEEYIENLKQEIRDWKGTFAHAQTEADIRIKGLEDELKVKSPHDKIHCDKKGSWR